jgi:hypothetical protein
VNLSELDLRQQYFLLNLRMACEAVQVAIPLGELENKKVQATFKILITVCNPYIPCGLSNHSTLSPF